MQVVRAELRFLILGNNEKYRKFASLIYLIAAVLEGLSCPSC